MGQVVNDAREDYKESRGVRRDEVVRELCKALSCGLFINACGTSSLDREG